MIFIDSPLEPGGEAEVAAVRARLGLTGPYLLGLGTLEPRKDLPSLIDAYARAAAAARG